MESVVFRSPYFPFHLPVASRISPIIDVAGPRRLSHLSVVSYYAFLMMSLWSCSSCTKSFARKGDLTRHQLLHTGVKPHVCVLCNKGFAQLSALKIHLNTHTKAKPYVCGVGLCRKAFGDPSSCSRHRKETHGRERAYTCPLSDCGTSIKRRSAFVAHMRRHGIDTSMYDVNAGGSAVIDPPLPVPAVREPWKVEEPCLPVAPPPDNQTPLSSFATPVEPSNDKVGCATVPRIFFSDPEGNLCGDSSFLSSSTMPAVTEYSSTTDWGSLSSLAAMPTYDMFYDGSASKSAGFGMDYVPLDYDYSMLSSSLRMPALEAFSDDDSTLSRSETSSPLCLPLDLSSLFTF